MINKNIFVLVILSMVQICCKNKTNQIESTSLRSITLQLNGKQYDQLTLKASLHGPNSSYKILFFTGTSITENKWQFSIPDSIIELTDNLVIITHPFDIKTNTFFCVKFSNPFKDDEHRYHYIYDENNPNIIATYLRTYKTEGDSGDGNFFIVNDTLIVDGISRYEDIYEVQFNEETETELELSMKFSGFSFINFGNYENSIVQLDSIINKHPDSKYLMNQFYDLFKEIRMEDARSIYLNFSEKNRYSGFGKAINDYLHLYSSPFKNTTLINSKTDLAEPIVLDSTKVNLLIFSASWCSHCHKLIPELKEVYNDLYPFMEMVYVSLDELQYVENWKKLIVENKIPWRSVSAFGHVKEIVSKYDAGSLPHMLLILPDKTVKKIDIRLNEDKKELYRIVNIAK